MSYMKRCLEDVLNEYDNEEAAKILGISEELVEYYRHPFEEMFKGDS